jgi:hypothetical protein
MAALEESRRINPGLFFVEIKYLSVLTPLFTLLIKPWLPVIYKRTRWKIDIGSFISVEGIMKKEKKRRKKKKEKNNKNTSINKFKELLSIPPLKNI